MGCTDAALQICSHCLAHNAAAHMALYYINLDNTLLWLLTHMFTVLSRWQSAVADILAHHGKQDLLAQATGGDSPGRLSRESKDSPVLAATAALISAAMLCAAV